MSSPNIADTLRTLSFLQDIDEGLLVRIAAVATPVTFTKDELVFREGDPADELFLIIRGNVSLEVCAPGVGCRRILSVTKGELLGWSPLLGQSRLTATARAIDDTDAIRINGPTILEACEDDPALGYAVMRRVALALSKRLSAARLQLLDIYGTEPVQAKRLA